MGGSCRKVRTTRGPPASSHVVTRKPGIPIMLCVGETLSLALLTGTDLADPRDEAFSLHIARARCVRRSIGVSPVQRLKALKKALGSEKPSKNEISDIESPSPR